MKYIKFTALTLIFIFIINSFGGCAASITKSHKPQLLATTTMLGDLAREICGDKIDVMCLMKPGVDPHLYRASARDCIRLQEADVVLCNGIMLEGRMNDALMVTRETGKTVLSVEDAIPTELLIKVGENTYDPHVWFDVSLWMLAARYLGLALSRAYPEYAEYFTARCEAYLAELCELQSYVIKRTAELPVEKRVLITAHDAFGYFGRAYSYSVYGIQGIATTTEAGIADISRLAQMIAEFKVPAVFIENSVSKKTVEALLSAAHARGAEVSEGGMLYADSLGDEESGASGYVAAVRHNVDAVVDGLKG